MTGLKVPCVLLAVLMCVVVLRCDSFPNIPAILNENVILSFNCSEQEVEFAIVSPIKTTIARCKNWTCEIDETFKKRFSILGDNSSKNYTMHISSTIYIDAGTYSCISDGVEVSSVKLHMYNPETVTAFEGENITLRCFGDTREMAKNVLWMKGVKKVLEYTFGKSHEAPAGRFFMSNKSYQEGNLSLFIISTELSDAGLYRCFIHDESRDGDPRAVLLVVIKQEPTNQPDTKSSRHDIVIPVVATFVTVIAIIGLAVYMVRRKGFCNKTANVRVPVQEEHPLNENKTSVVTYYLN